TQDLASLQQETHVSFPPLEMFSQRINPDTSSILEYNGIKLEIPAGAVDYEVTIEIIKLEFAPSVNETIKNVTAGAASYRFLPDGIHFNKNIKISIPFSKAVLESETALSNLFTYFYDEAGNNWERLPRVEIDKENVVVVSLNHFTDMINATLKMPESPGPVNFDINSIKNLETANPSSGVMSLKGLTPDSGGSASFQIPLNIPPGRGSAYPNLALSYNSESPNSWMGRGFDISVPSITTDTRFGLPKYDDTDTYILGGEELVLTSSSGSGKIYRSRVEKEFKRIVRTQSTEFDYWEITDKNGRVQIFGIEEGWIGPDRTNHSKTYTWYLTKETDANGNFVSYIYDYDSDNKYTYLKEVHYSGNNNISTTDKGPYKVVFNTSSSRPDRRIDARGTYISKLVKRLDKVQISYNGDVFRTYAFGYEQNEFGQTVLKSFTELDGSGNEFYVYGFDYNKLSTRDAGAGIIAYDGFGEEAIEWGAVTGSTFPGLNQTRTFGIGASLYLGVKFELLKHVSFLKWRWRTIAELGVRGGVNFSGTIAKSTLLDINGDGLSDAVWRDGGTLKAYPNTGFGFDTGNELTLPGLPGLLNRSNQKGFSLGVTAGLLGVSGSITMQRNWMNGLSVFTDINGDGFIDFLKADNDKYYMNTVNNFTPVSFTNSLVEVSQSENINEEDYLRTYFSQEPLRKWKAYTGGSIEVTQTVNLIDPNLVSDDGIIAVTYPEDGYPVSSITLRSDHPTGSDSRSFDIEDGDEMFFHMDALEDSRGDNIQWDINISYTDINYFEKLNETVIIFPEEHYLYSLPDNRLVDFYDSEYVRYQTDPSRYRWEYTLKQNWEDYFNTSSGNAIIENGFFVPARIPEDIFVTIFSSASDTETILDIYGEPEDLILGGKAALIDSYNYRAEFKDFIRRNSGANETIRDILALQELSLMQLQELFYYNDFEGSNIYPDEAGGVTSYSKVAPLISIIPMIHAEGEGVNPGSEFLNGEILLDKIYNDTGTVVVESLFLVPNSGSLGLESRGSQGTFMIPGAV
ncbi:MAG: hypothetical protein KAH95_08495, partial [Spirochaetales bacterium]|nr:hypothetical protein [Spirochaetales bacterium]